MTNTEDDIKVLRNDLAQLRQDMSKLADTLQALARHSGDEALGKVRDTSDKLREEVRAKTEGLTQKIEEQPITAALTTFAVGVVLGALFSGRRG